MHIRSAFSAALLAVCVALAASSCAVDRMVVRAVADGLTSDGGSTVFTGDEDPELVGDAIPFAVKLYESLLVKAPDHDGLVVATGSMFVMYANAFVQARAEVLPADRFQERKDQLYRAKRLYLRGRGILADGLERKFPGFKTALKDGTLDRILKKAKKADVPYLYWTAAASLAAFSLDPFDLQLSVRVPESKALMARAYELDPDFGNGAIDDFYVSFYGALPTGLGGDRTLAKKHFELALKKTNGKSAGPFVSYAQAISIPDQDYKGFKKLLDQALAVDVNADPSTRLANIISQRRAKHLLSTAADLFIDAGDSTEEAVEPAADQTKNVSNEGASNK